MASSGAKPDQRLCDALHIEGRPGTVINTLVWTVIVAGAYYAGGKLGLGLFPFEKNVAVLWPSSAIALAALLVLGARMLPAVFIGCALLDLTASAPLREVIQSASVTTFYSGIAYVVLRHVARIDIGLRRLIDVVMFLVLGVGTVILLKGGVTSGLLALRFGAVPDDMVGPVWVSALAAGVGILVITPAILTCVATWNEPIRGERRLEAVVMVAMTMAVALLVFFDRQFSLGPLGSHLPYALFPFIFWAGARFGPREVAVTLLVASVIAIKCTADEMGPFGSQPVLEALTSLYLFIGVLGTTGLMFASGLRQRADADRKARVSGEQYRMLIERMNEGLMIQDAQGAMTYVSDRFCEITGYARYQLIGRPLDAFIADTECAARATKGASQSNSATDSYEVTLTKRNGEQIAALLSPKPLFDDAGQSVGSFALVTDVTERRRAEESLRESEANYRLLVENQSDLVLKIARGGTVAFASPSCRQLLGESAVNMVGHPLAIKIHDDDVELTKAAWSAVWESPYVSNFESRVMTKDGWRWLAWSARAIDEDKLQGDVSAVIAVARDVTERRRAEEQARQHLQQLAHVARVSSMGEMASAIAHEINQPLTTIANYANACVILLESGQSKEGELLDTMKRVAAQAERAGDVVRKMRSFVRGDEGQATAVSVKFIVTEVLRLALPDARENGVAIMLDLDSELPDVLADSVQIQQVLLNLVRNAIEAISTAKSIAREVRIASRRGPPGYLELRVQDTGPGIPTDMLGKIFDAFYTTKADGMGIGLALSRSIVDAHGGRLWASAGKMGATFHLTLPLMDNDQENGNKHERES
ncbi:MAG: PAS domain S-box protein [Burkholderiales bacterium]